MPFYQYSVWSCRVGNFRPLYNLYGMQMLYKWADGFSAIQQMTGKWSNDKPQGAEALWGGNSYSIDHYLTCLLCTWRFLLCLQEFLSLNTFLSQLTLPYIFSTCCLISTFRCVCSITESNFIMSVWPRGTFRPPPDRFWWSFIFGDWNKQRPCEVLTVIPLIITLPVSRELEDYYCVHKSPCHWTLF